MTPRRTFHHGRKAQPASIGLTGPAAWAKRGTQGFSLVEVLVALVIFSIGALAVGQLAGLLLRHGEAARHRTEATLLAQARLDELRTFATLSDDAGGASAAEPASEPPNQRPSYATLRSGADRPLAQSNTPYARRWQIDGAPDAAQRRIDVHVDWTDRDGHADPNGVRLSAIVARVDPADMGRLAMTSAATLEAHQPQGRAILVPLEARPLGGDLRGRSLLRWRGASGGFLVLRDSDGAVTAQCAQAPRDEAEIASRCEPMPALLLSGHLSGPAVAEALNVTIAQPQHLLAQPECHIQDAVDAEGRWIAGVRTYRCLLRPADHDGNAGTPRVWSGRAIVLPEPTGTRRVCRYTSASNTAASATPLRNEDHPAVYTLVSRSLSHQNFALTSNGECPAGSVAHQPG